MKKGLGAESDQTHYAMSLPLIPALRKDLGKVDGRGQKSGPPHHLMTGNVFVGRSGENGLGGDQRTQVGRCLPPR